MQTHIRNNFVYILAYEAENKPTRRKTSSSWCISKFNSNEELQEENLTNKTKGENKNECECFIMGSKHRETNESTRRDAECFYCFEVFQTYDETRSTSFLYGFSNETIGNMQWHVFLNKTIQTKQNNYTVLECLWSKK